jgi:hypothetical protein
MNPDQSKSDEKWESKSDKKWKSKSESNKEVQNRNNGSKCETQYEQDEIS